jgi:hypothetical protein
MLRDCWKLPQDHVPLSAAQYLLLFITPDIGVLSPQGNMAIRQPTPVQYFQFSASAKAGVLKSLVNSNNRLVN